MVISRTLINNDAGNDDGKTEEDEINDDAMVFWRRASMFAMVVVADVRSSMMILLRFFVAGADGSQQSVFLPYRTFELNYWGPPKLRSLSQLLLKGWSCFLLHPVIHLKARPLLQ